jgi:hypothetical protein
MFAYLIGALIDKGETGRAKKALDYCDQVIPGTTVRHGYPSVQLAAYYYTLKEPAKGNVIMDAVAKDCVENIDWYLSLDANRQHGVSNELNQNLGILYQVLHICFQENQKPVLDKYTPRYEEYTKRFKM